MFIQYFCLPTDIDHRQLLFSSSEEPPEGHYIYLSVGTNAGDMPRSHGDTTVSYPISAVIYPTPDQFCSYLRPGFAQYLNELGDRCKVDIVINAETRPEIVLVGNVVDVELANVQLLILFDQLNGLS